MTALPFVPHVMRLEMIFKNAVDQDIINRYFISYSSVDTLNNAACLAAAVNAGGAWNGNLAQFTHPDLTLAYIRCTNLSDATTGDALYQYGIAGTAAGGPLPAGVALLCNFAVARRYRGGKPRVYLPYFTESDIQDPGQWKPASITAITPHMQTFLTSIAGGNNYGGVVFQQQVNVSYYSGVLPPVTLPSGRVKQASQVRPAAQVDAITGFSINKMYGSQRRRNRASV